MPDPLAIYGAALSTVLGLIALRQAIRDRPRLLIEWNWNVGLRGVWLGVDVTSRPRGQGTSIVQVGLALEEVADLSQLPDESYPRGEPVAAKGHFAFPLSEELTVLEPGRRVAFTTPAGAIPPLIDPDTPLVPYVVDVEGRRHDGQPLPIFQMMIDQGWTPPDEPTFRIALVTYAEPPAVAGHQAHFAL